MQTNIQQRLDHVISKVHRDLLEQQVIVPQYQKGKIIVGSVSIVSNEASKDIVKDNGQYDIIILYDVIDHLEDETITECLEFLKEILADFYYYCPGSYYANVISEEFKKELS